MRAILVHTVAVACLLGGVTVASGTHAAEAPERTRSSEATATALLKDADGARVGEVDLQETPHGVLLKAELEGLPPGVRAFHVHETGRCEPPDFESAGGHFAQATSRHGFFNEEGPHPGDLPNLHVPPDGRLSIELLVQGVTLGPGPRSLLDGNGSALVIHEREDDHRTDPAGEAGDRIACGPITQ